MLCRKSYCNTTVIRSDLRHYWPMLFLYAAIWVVILPLSMWSAIQSGNEPDLGEQIWGSLPLGAAIAGIFGGALAMALFAYLMNGRSVGMMHAMPIRRSELFTSHFVAGMGMLTAGNLLTMALCLLLQLSRHHVAWQEMLLWLLIVTVMELFFFSLGILCVMLTGWLLAVPLIYLVANFLAVGITELLRALADLFYPSFSGLSDYPDITIWLTPYLRLEDVLIGYDEPGRCRSTLILYGVLTLVFLLLAWLLYSRRSSESAGDPLTFRWLQPVFRFGVGFFGGIALGYVLYMICYWGSSLSLPFLLACQIVMAGVCRMAAEMVVKKSLGVFRNCWKGLAVVWAAVILLCAAMHYDIIGFEGYVPAAEEIQTVKIYVYWDSGSFDATCDEAETIAAVLDAHRELIRQDDEVYNGNMTIAYRLKNGRQAVRQYGLTSADDQVIAAVNALLHTEEVRREMLLPENIPEECQSIGGGVISWYGEGFDNLYRELSAEEARELCEAIKRDADQGHGMIDLGGSSYGSISIELWDNEGESWQVNALQPDCTETIQKIIELGVVSSAEELFASPEAQEAITYEN